LINVAPQKRCGAQNDLRETVPLRRHFLPLKPIAGGRRIPHLNNYLYG